MYKYHCLNPISEVGLAQLDENYVVTGNADEADAILVRSAKMHDMEFSRNLKAIARAEPASTIFRWSAVPTRESSCSIRREPMQTA